MKKIILGTLISMVSLAALAQSDADTQTVTIGAMSPKYDITQGVRPMSSNEFGKYAGSYDLSNGKSLSLFSRGLKKYAVVQGEPSHEIVATRADTFVSKDQKLKMTLVREENGDARGELLIATAQPQPEPQVQPVAAHVTAKKSKYMVAHVSLPKSKQMVASR